VSGPRIRPFGVLAVLIVLSLVLAACGSSSKPPSSNGPTTTVFSGTVPNGGTIVVGAEQEPDCFDWLGGCSGSSWGTWMAQIMTIPYAFRDVPRTGRSWRSRVRCSPASPTSSRRRRKRSLTNIKPEAKWSDGVDISCADFQYVTAQQQHGKDLYDPTGYVDANGDPMFDVTCPNPKTAVITYRKGQTFAGWHQLFASGAGLLPRTSCRAGSRQGAEGRLQRGRGARGSRSGTRATTSSSRRTRASGDRSRTSTRSCSSSRATPRPSSRHSSRVRSTRSTPQPQLDSVAAIKEGITGAHTQYNPHTGTIEALWPNDAKFPFDTKAVRQAFAYSIDRKTIVEKLSARWVSPSPPTRSTPTS